MVDREARMAAEQDVIERELTLVGATAVEDKLQVRQRVRCACMRALSTHARACTQRLVSAHVCASK